MRDKAATDTGRNGRSSVRKSQPGSIEEDSSIREVTLPNGMPILFEKMPSLRSVTVAVWARIGSRHEDPSEYGIAHVVEHMIFKGTATRTARQIAESLEFIGGESNAFTSREYSCYYAKVANTDWDLAIDVLSDIVRKSTFDKVELEKERKVILEEIAMYEDNPEEMSHENLSSRIFDDRLGHPIIGTREIVQSMTQKQVSRFYKDYYHPSNLFVTVVGNLSDDAFQRGIDRFWPEAAPKRALKPEEGKSRFRKGHTEVRKEIEQLHLCLATKGLPVVHKDRFVLHLINNYLGGGMSSRLFQEIREKRGLAYSVYTFVQAYRDIGFFGIYCGTSPNRVDKVKALVRSELERVAEKGISQKRLRQLKRQVRAGFLLGLEKTGFRINRLGVSQIYFGKTYSVDDVVAQIDSITHEDVLRVSRKLFSRGIQASALVRPMKDR